MRSWLSFSSRTNTHAISVDSVIGLTSGYLSPGTMSRASHSGSFSASLAAMSALGMKTTLAVTSCICSSTGPGIARPSSTRLLHLPRHKVCTQTYFTPFRILAEPLFLFPHTAMTPFQQTIRYCWRTLLAVIWTALVAQEGASNANGEGPCRDSRPFCKLGHLAIQLGFANSIRPLSKTPPNTSTYPLKRPVFRFICPSHKL